MDPSQDKYHDVRLFRHGQHSAWRVLFRCLSLVFLSVFLTDSVRAELVPDSLWLFRQKDAHHHSEQNEIWLSADRPGFRTGSEVLNRGFIQWETGFEAAHFLGLHSVMLPSALFRFGVHKRVELRLEYCGILEINDRSDTLSAILEEMSPFTGSSSTPLPAHWRKSNKHWNENDRHHKHVLAFAAETICSGWRIPRYP